MKKDKIKIEKRKIRIPVPQKPPKVEDKKRYKRPSNKKQITDDTDYSDSQR